MPSIRPSHTGDPDLRPRHRPLPLQSVRLLHPLRTLLSSLLSSSDPLTLPSLSLLCAVYGDTREAVIGDIMALPEEQQLGLMSLINDWSLKAGIEGPDDLSDPLASPASHSNTPSVPSSPKTLSGPHPDPHDPRSRATSSGERSEKEFQAMKTRLEAALRTRDADVEALRRQLKAHGEEAREREVEVRTEAERVAGERTAQLERALVEARRGDAARQVRQMEAELAAAQEETVAGRARELALRREKEKCDKEKAELAEILRGVKDELLVCQQRLDDLALVKQQLNRAQQRLELVSELREQYAELETECREKADRITTLEAEVDSTRLSAQRQVEREWRETLRLKDVDLSEARLRVERADEEAAQFGAELRALKEEMRRHREETRDWDLKALPSRSLALSIADMPMHRASVTQPGLGRPSVGERDAGAEEEKAEWKRRLDAMRAEVEAERAARVKAEAMQAEGSRRWEGERLRSRRLQVKVREYEAMMKETDRLRLEEELQGMREQAMVSSALHGLAEDVSTRLLMKRHGLSQLPPDGEERKEVLHPS